VNIRHRRRARRGNGRLCFCDPRIQLRIHLFAARFGGRCRLFTGLTGERLRARARFCQRLLVCRSGGVGLIFEPLRFR
jgi:hypothetical protein